MNSENGVLKRDCGYSRVVEVRLGDRQADK